MKKFLIFSRGSYSSGSVCSPHPKSEQLFFLSSSQPKRATPGTLGRARLATTSFGFALPRPPNIHCVTVCASFNMAALFVGGLSGRSTPMDIEALFSRFGPCRADVRTGWAFIFYQARHHAEEAMRVLNRRVRLHCDHSTSSCFPY